MPITRTVVVAALAAMLAGAHAAHADLKVVQSTTVKNPQFTAMIQSMSPEQRARMAHSPMGAMFSGGAIITTIYTHGSKTRVDIGSQSTIMDMAAHKMITLNRAAHTYTTSAYSPQSAASQMQAKVRDTGQTRTIMNHPTRHYIVSLSSPQMQGGQISGDIWSAQDLPQPPASALVGPAGALQGEFRKIKGMPLLLNLTMSGSPVGAITIHSVTKSVSRSPVSASLFLIPPGYTRVAASARPGGM